MLLTLVRLEKFRKFSNALMVMGGLILVGRQIGPSSLESNLQSATKFSYADIFDLAILL